MSVSNRKPRHLNKNFALHVRPVFGDRGDAPVWTVMITAKHRASPAPVAAGVLCVVGAGSAAFNDAREIAAHPQTIKRHAERGSIIRDFSDAPPFVTTTDLDRLAREIPKPHSKLWWHYFQTLHQIKATIDKPLLRLDQINILIGNAAGDDKIDTLQMLVALHVFDQVPQEQRRALMNGWTFPKRTTPAEFKEAMGQVSSQDVGQQVTPTLIGDRLFCSQEWAWSESARDCEVRIRPGSTQKAVLSQLDFARHIVEARWQEVIAEASSTPADPPQ